MLRTTGIQEKAFSLIYLGLIFLLSSFSALESFENKMRLPFLFGIRDYLGLGPEIHPKLKIISFDDSTMDRLQRSELTIDDWADLLSGLDAVGPAAIYIDKSFSVIFDPKDSKEQNIARISQVRTPIHAGAFAVKQQRKSRDLVNEDFQDYQKIVKVFSPERVRDFRSWFMYGPKAELRKEFAASGHIMSGEFGVVDPLVRVDDDVYVPHLGLIQNSDMVLDDGKLFIGKRSIQLNQRNELVVNFISPSKFYKTHLALGKILSDIREKNPIQKIEAGDTVLILPEMSTGSTDFKASPVGQIPGGFIVASILNSQLSGEWLGFVNQSTLIVCLLWLLGFLVGQKIRGNFFWISVPLICVCFLIASAVLFIRFGAVAPILMPTVAFISSAILFFSFKTKRREKIARKNLDELNDAAAIARAFKPDDHPRWSDLKVATFHKQLSFASGDWFAFRESKDQRLKHFILCDITGHGVQAAIIVSTCKTVLETLIAGQKDLLESREFILRFAEELNRILFRIGGGQHIVTCLGITFEISEKKIHHFSAGHPGPLLLDQKTKNVRKLISKQSALIGWRENISVSLTTSDFKSDEHLIAFSDGLPFWSNLRRLRLQLGDLDRVTKITLEQLYEIIAQFEASQKHPREKDDVSIISFKQAS